MPGSSDIDNTVNGNETVATVHSIGMGPHSQCQVPQSPQTGGEAVVMSDDDGGVERLKV